MKGVAGGRVSADFLELSSHCSTWASGEPGTENWSAVTLDTKAEAIQGDFCCWLKLNESDYFWLGAVI